MSNDDSIREQGYQYFVTEAPELLQAIEQDLLTLREDYSLVKVHSLMRTTHTLKGAAANMGLETIKTIAHHLEDVFKSLYNPDLSIDLELEKLLFEGYECLRLPLMLQIQGNYVNDEEILERAVAVFAALEDKLGDYFGRETQIPTSVELGFDITKSIFEVGVKQRLEELANVVNNAQPWEIEAALREQAEIFVGLAESLNLPGFGAIAEKTMAALDLHPQQIFSIAQVALNDFWEAWSAVIAGDRIRGGEPSFTLQQLAGTILPATVKIVADDESGRAGETEEQADILLETEPVFAALLDQSEPTLDELKNPIELPEVLLEPSLEDIFGDFSSEELLIEDQIVEPIGVKQELQQEQEIKLPTTAERLDEAEKLTEDVEEIATEENISISPPSYIPAPPPNVVQKVHPTSVQSPASSIPNQPSSASNPVKINRQSVRVDVELLEKLSHLVGELLINQNRLTNIGEQLQECVKRARSRLQRHYQTISHLRDWSDQILITQERQRVLEIKDWVFKSSFDSLELDEFNELHILLQTLLEEMVQLEETVDSTDLLGRQSNQILEKQKRLLNNVQDDMREARMLPVGDIFNRFPRLLQQLANTHHKKVELTLQGTDVLVDRALAEKLYDPLLHLVRNAFDHGIESPQIRASRGKPETGQIQISAYHRGNQTIIEISDDGDGVNFDRVRQRAIEQNWMTPEKVKNLSETALLEILFEPGFSTVSQVSDLSGRGIGLNVVRSQMESLMGSVVIHSEPQRGTVFSLQFPLTLTVAKLMVCEAGNSVYALLSDAIDQIIIPKSDQIQTLEGQKVLRLNRGNTQCMVPIYSMGELLGTYSPSVPLYSCPLILLRQHSQTENLAEELLGLEVDQIMGEQELVIRPLGKAIAPPNYVYGGSTLADGRLTLVIDGNALVNHLFEKMASKIVVGELTTKNILAKAQIPALSPSPVLSSLPPSPELIRISSAPTIMVVDDSISLRQTLALMLQKAGYQVIQSENGREALQEMRQNSGIQLVICDVEMPLMNGFEFLNHCRQDAVLAKTPVVMLTARRGEKHRMLAKEMGAVAYFNKPYRDDEILSEIAKLLTSKTPALV